MTAAPDPKKTTTAWGISQNTLDHFAVQYNGSIGLVYPSLSGHRNRVLLLDTKLTGLKNFWDRLTSHLPMPPLFNIPALTLPPSKPAVYLSNGEKSTFAMHTAGVLNVVNTFGEGSRVPDAIAVLREHDIQKLICIPDCDTPGLKAALRWQTQSANTELQVEFRDLRLFLETEFGMSPHDYHKWDTRDLWLLLKQDKAAFRQALETLPLLDFGRYADELPQPNPHKTRPSVSESKPEKTLSGEIDFLAAYDNWWQTQVLPALDRVSPPPPRGQHRHCPNPHHQDTHPSFRISEQGIPQCTCGIQHQPKPREILAGWVGAVSWEDYKQRLFLEKHHPRQHTAPLPDEPYHFRFGVPNLLREAFLRLKRGGFVYDHAGAALVYDLWHEGIFDDRWLPTDPLTIPALQEFAATRGHHTSPKAIREGMAQLTALGFFTLINPHTPPRGRPIDRYQAQPLPDAFATFRAHLRYRVRERLFADSTPDTVLAAWFPDLAPDAAQRHADYHNQQRTALYDQAKDRIAQVEKLYEIFLAHIDTTLTPAHLSQQPSAELPDDIPWRNGSRYRDAYYLYVSRQRIQQQQPISRKNASQQVGITEKTLSGIRNRLGIVTDARFKEIPITKPERVRERVDTAAPWAAQRTHGRYLESSSGSGIHIRPDQDDDLDAWAAEQLAAGHTLTAKIQTASQEREAAEEELQELAFRRQRNREEALRRAQYQTAAPKPPPLPPPERVSLPQLVARYITMQLRMTEVDDLAAYAERELGAVITDLFPFSPPLDSLPEREEGKKENKELPPDDLHDASALGNGGQDT